MTQEMGVFHAGEKQMHEKLDVSERVQKLGQLLIRDYMPDQHREFFEKLVSIHLGALDSNGHPWAIMRTGSAGFITSPHNKQLRIVSKPLSCEPEDLMLEQGAKVSVVGIEFETRRRNRANVTISSSDADTLTLHVDQSYGNCPKYIQVRNGSKVEVAPSQNIQVDNKLSTVAQKQIESADTLLIASRAPNLNDDPRAGVDINHRGGMPGFVTVLDQSTIQFPDYKGNNFYNTFGNILTDNRIGLQFVDFETGTLLNLKGTAEIIEDLNDGALPLMGRGLRISIASVVRAEHALPLRFEFGEFSDLNPEISK